jgi:hypothetical protein
MILQETLSWLQARGVGAGRAIRSLHLTPYFHIVALDDGSVGAAMNYATLAAHEFGDLETQVRARLAADPLLLEWFFTGRSVGHDNKDEREQLRLVKKSLRAAVVSALSAPFLRAGGDEHFAAYRAPPIDPIAAAHSALVIGFGGYLESLAQADHIGELHVHDLGYASRAQEMDAVAERYRRASPAKRIFLSDGHDTAQRLRQVDVVAITGSTLCNGTLEQLLEQARGGPRIVLQGQSASIHPVALFRHGVSFVATTVKPLELVQLAAADPSGAALKPLLEGGLPQVYCVPRGAE